MERNASERRHEWESLSDVLRSVTQGASRASGETSDLLVNGKPYDVYTPTSSRIENILDNMIAKGDQVRGGGLVIDLSKTSVTQADIARFAASKGETILSAVQKGASGIMNIVFLPK